MKRLMTRLTFVFISIFTLVTLSGCAKVIDKEGNISPINTTYFWDKVFIQPVARAMSFIIENTGGEFWIGIIITTILVRTILFPVYTKTNDTSVRMQEAQPEINKIKEKYEGKTDPDSRQKQNFELMQIYKKYNINILAGCLMPFLQMPVFMAMYHTVVKLPASKETISFFPKSGIDSHFLWLNLTEKDPIFVLPILVALTAVALQVISMYGLSKEAKSNSTMKMMMYMMPAMMFIFSISQAAALSLYWIAGNIFSTIQIIIVKKPFSKKNK